MNSEFNDLFESLLSESFLKGNKTDPDDLEVFIKKRSQGAQKIQQSADAKGGFSTLTAIHFKAKEIPYKQSAKHVNDKDSSFFKKKADECFSKLKNWKNMSQKEFQHVMGQLEAYGEIYIRSIEDKGK
jgi:hypothetical protein